MEYIKKTQPKHFLCPRALLLWETGNRLPDIETVKRIADYFGVTVEYLIGSPESCQPKEVTERDIKFALFNGTEGITDEMYAEVKQFAEMVKLREENKRKGKA